jgi:curved DNA-binding protein CbpA
MHGQLNDHPLAELIHEISDARLSGALRLARESVKAAVYFSEGQTLAAFMNLRANRLVEMLRRAGAVDAERLGAVVREGMTDEQAGAAIVRAGLLSASEMWRLQTRQSSETLRELLRWTDCEWSFEQRVRLAGNQRAQPNTPQLLIECGRNFPHEMISRRMGDEGETVAPAEGATEKIEVIQLMPNEAFVLSRVGGPMRMSEVVAVSGLPAELTRRAVYALALGGLLERGRWASALPAELTEESRARAAAATEGAAHDTDPQQDAQAQQKPIEAREANPLSVVEELFARANGTNHYEVMGVVRTASLDEVKRAYYSHAKRFHPDLFRRDADAPLQQQIDAAFAKIAQAYDVLKDSSLRAAYDLKLAKRKLGGTPQSAPPSVAQPDRDEAGTHSAEGATGAREDAPLNSDAEQKFQQGMTALQQNDLTRAYTLLKEAARLVPKQARYRAYFGRVLARDKTSRRQAESELLAAVSLDAENASYRVMLAELYLDVGLRRKAEGELQRALALEPGNATARRMLEELSGAS